MQKLNNDEIRKEIKTLLGNDAISSECVVYVCKMTEWILDLIKDEGNKSEISSKEGQSFSFSIDVVRAYLNIKKDSEYYNFKTFKEYVLTIIIQIFTKWGYKIKVKEEGSPVYRFNLNVQKNIKFIDIEEEKINKRESRKQRRKSRFDDNAILKEFKEICAVTHRAEGIYNISSILEMCKITPALSKYSWTTNDIEEGLNYLKIKNKHNKSIIQKKLDNDKEKRKEEEKQKQEQDEKLKIEESKKEEKKKEEKEEKKIIEDETTGQMKIQEVKAIDASEYKKDRRKIKYPLEFKIETIYNWQKEWVKEVENALILSREDRNKIIEKMYQLLLDNDCYTEYLKSSIMQIKETEIKSRLNFCLYRWIVSINKKNYMKEQKLYYYYDKNITKLKVYKEIKNLQGDSFKDDKELLDKLKEEDKANRIKKEDKEEKKVEKVDKVVVEVKEEEKNKVPDKIEEQKIDKIKEEKKIEKEEVKKKQQVRYLVMFKSKEGLFTKTQCNEFVVEAENEKDAYLEALDKFYFYYDYNRISKIRIMQKTIIVKRI